MRSDEEDAVRVDVYHHFGDGMDLVKGINDKLDAILRATQEIKMKEEHMSKELDALEVAVSENTSLDDSIIVLVNDLAAQIVAMKDDPVKLQALADSLTAKSAALAAAIQANTTAP
jgi:hypothetical protein